MTARQPRRTRRRALPANTLPRPTAGAVAEAEPEDVEEAPATVGRTSRRSAVHHREHHVTRDYSYVHRDLITVSIIGVFVIAFIVGMSYIL